MKSERTRLDVVGNPGVPFGLGAGRVVDALLGETVFGSTRKLLIGSLRVARYRGVSLALLRGEHRSPNSTILRIDAVDCLQQFPSRFLQPRRGLIGSNHILEIPLARVRGSARLPASPLGSGAGAVLELRQLKKPDCEEQGGASLARAWEGIAPRQCI
jgi:hypothetical protein